MRAAPSSTGRPLRRCSVIAEIPWAGRLSPSLASSFELSRTTMTAPNPSSVADDDDSLTLSPHRRDFVSLWFAQTISAFGTMLTRVALPLAAIITLDSTPIQLGALQAAEAIPVMLAGLVAGVWVDRLLGWRPVMVWADLGRALTLCWIPIAAFACTPSSSSISSTQRRQASWPCSPHCSIQPTRHTFPSSSGRIASSEATPASRRRRRPRRWRGLRRAAASCRFSALPSRSSSMP